MSNKKQEDIYDVSTYTDNELLELLDLNNPTDRELEAKIIFMIKKYSNMQNKSGDQFAKFFTDIYNHFFEVDNTQEEEEETNENIKISITENFENNIQTISQQPQQQQQQPLQEQQPQQQNNQQMQTQNIGFIKPLDYAPDQLNPLLNQTIKRIISIDSQYRDDKTTLTTDFAFNLSTPLKDVVSLKLYSVHIPYTWYTISKSYGSNFFYLKGNVPGIINNPSQNIMIDISAGNYTPQELVTSINNSITLKKQVYSDVNFGNTNISYNSNTSLATINIDITKQFNENSYYLQFENFTSPVNGDTSRNLSIPSFLGFNYQKYDTNVLNSPPIFPIYNPNLISELDSTPLFKIDTTNNYFSIIKYIGNYNTSTKTIDPFNLSTATIDLSFNIILSNLIIGRKYSRNDIWNEVQNQISNCTYLSNESYFQRINITDTSNINFPNSYFQMKLKPNRYTTNNISNSKVAVIFPNESSIWTSSTSCFGFVNQINDMNSIVAETKAVPQTINYDVLGRPKIFITCSAEHFISPLNNIEIDVQGSPIGLPYTTNQYISAINTGIVNATQLTPFLGGSLTTDYNYIYSPYVTPQHSYAYIDDNDYFNLFLTINKNFNQSMYRLDLTNTFLYDNLNLGNVGNNSNNPQNVTQNDTLSIQGIVTNNNLLITSGEMPKLDLNNVKLKISFDVSGVTYGSSTYGNLYLSKGDQNYLDNNINNNWYLQGNAYVITETTYIVRSNQFNINGNMYVPSNLVDISTNSFTIPQTSYLSISGNYVNIPTYLSTVYFDNQTIQINGQNMSFYSPSWKLNGNSWTTNTNNSWTINGNTFTADNNIWSANNNYILTSTNKDISINQITLSGDLIELSGNYFDVSNGNISNNLINLYYKDFSNNITWNLSAIDISYDIPKYDIKTSRFNATTTYSDPLIINTTNTQIYNNSIVLKGNNLLFSETTTSPTSPTSNIIVYGNIIIDSLNNYNFNANTINMQMNDLNFNITCNTMNYYNNYININQNNFTLPNNNIYITGTLISINSNSSFVINQPAFNITGNNLSLSNNYFNIENSVSLTTNNVQLVSNIIKYNDIISYGDTFNIINTNDRINAEGYYWDISCDKVTFYNYVNYQDPLNPNYKNYTHSITGNIKYKGNNIIIPNTINNVNKVSLNYATTNTATVFTDGIITSNAINIQPTLGGIMQIDISQAIVSSPLQDIQITGQDTAMQPLSPYFLMDVSFISINNNINSLTFYANDISMSSPNNLISFDYSNVWSLKGKNIIIYTKTNFTLNGTYYDANTNYQIGDGTIYINKTNNTVTINNVTYPYSGSIDYANGTDLYLYAINDNFSINRGSFNIRGNTILIDNILNATQGANGVSILYFTTTGFSIYGSILITPSDNYFAITTPNQSIYYTISGSKINITGNYLSIQKNIASVTGNILQEQTQTVNLNSISNMTITGIAYMQGNRSSILGTINTSQQNPSTSLITLSQDYNSNLYAKLYTQSSSTFVPSAISIIGNLNLISNNLLNIVGNITITNTDTFNTSFVTNNYPNTNIGISSISFNVTNGDNNDYLYLKRYPVRAYYKNWQSLNNTITINSNNDWVMSGTSLIVNNSGIQIKDSTITMSGNNFIIPGNTLVTSGNSISISGNAFYSESDQILITTNNNNPIIGVDSSSTIITNIYSSEYQLPDNTIKYYKNLNGSTIWTAISTSGYTINNNIQLPSNTTTIFGNKLSVYSTDVNNCRIYNTNLPNQTYLTISADLVSVANGDTITFIGKSYSLSRTNINLGTMQNIYNFNVNPIYTTPSYLPLTNLYSNSFLSSTYIIQSGETILKILPRFSEPIEVFGNENDVEYIIKNNTGKDIVNTSIIDLKNNINLLLNNYTDANGQNILSGSRLDLSINVVNNVPILNSVLNINFNKSLKTKDYVVEFANFIDSYSNNKPHIIESWKTNFFLDASMVDASYTLLNSTSNGIITTNTILNQTVIKGTTPIVTISIALQENINNKIRLVAYEDGAISNDVTITIPVYDNNGRLVLYSRNGLVKTINSLFENTIAAGTAFIVNIDGNNIPYVEVRPNINLIYKSKDYNLVFYDTISFVSCFVGAKSVRNTTWDTTVGWILGFRENSIYELSQYSQTSSGITVTGDTGVCTNLFNYFLLCIDDFTQNHLNDGLITITGTDKSIPLPSYANRTNFICDPASRQLTYNNANTVDYTKLTQNQIYSLTQIANNQGTTSSNLTRGINASSYGLGPFVQDVFGLVPIKTAGLQPGSSYIEFGGTLQNQERTYFGPVNIHRMSIKLVTDRGDVVDLNNVNWSFSLLCEQLYKQRPSKNT